MTTDHLTRRECPDHGAFYFDISERCAVDGCRARVVKRTYVAVDALAADFEQHGREYGMWTNGQVADEIRSFAEVKA